MGKREPKPRQWKMWALLVHGEAVEIWAAKTDAMRMYREYKKYISGHEVIRVIITEVKP